jgi:hypothetical protein
MPPLWHVETHCQLNILMKNNKGYYSWIHSLNEAAVKAQIFQQQLDEEKAKKKSGGMPGFFSSGPATPAKRKEETGEPNVPAHMQTTSRLGDTVQSEPRTVPVSNPETTAKKLPARPVELPKTPTRKPRTGRTQQDVESTIALNNPKEWGMTSFDLTTPQNREIARQINAQDAAAVANVDDEELNDLLSAENLERGAISTGKAETFAGAKSLARALQEPWSESEPGLSPEQANIQVGDFLRKRQEGIKGRMEGEEMIWEPENSKHWDEEFYKNYPEMKAVDKADLTPSAQDIDRDGTTGFEGDIDDVIAKVVTMDQSSWGQRTTEIDRKGKEVSKYINNTKGFGSLTRDPDLRTPQRWENALLQYRKDAADARRVVKSKIESRKASTPEFTSPVGTEARFVSPQTEVGSEMVGRPEDDSDIFSRRKARGGEDKIAGDPEDVIKGGENSRMAEISARLKKPGTKVRVTDKSGEVTLVPGAEFFAAELARQRRLPPDARRPRDNPQPDVARTEMRGEGEGARQVTLAGSVTRAGDTDKSPEEIRAMNAAAREEGIKGAREKLKREKLQAQIEKSKRRAAQKKAKKEPQTVQESIANIVNKMLLG